MFSSTHKVCIRTKRKRPHARTHTCKHGLEIIPTEIEHKEIRRVKPHSHNSLQYLLRWTKKKPQTIWYGVRVSPLEQLCFPTETQAMENLCSRILIAFYMMKWIGEWKKRKTTTTTTGTTEQWQCQCRDVVCLVCVNGHWTYTQVNGEQV